MTKHHDMKTFRWGGVIKVPRQ